MLDSPSWTWGLALIVLTTAIHSLGIVLLSLLGVRIRAYLKRQSFHLWQAITVLTDADRDDRAVACSPAWDRGRLVGGSLSLAGRTRYTRRSDALFNRFDDHARRLGVNTAPALAGDERIGRRCRRVVFGVSTAYMFFVMQLYLPEIYAIRRH